MVATDLGGELAKQKVVDRGELLSSLTMLLYATLRLLSPASRLVFRATPGTNPCALRRRESAGKAMMAGMAGAICSGAPAASALFRPPPRLRQANARQTGTSGEWLVDHIAAGHICPHAPNAANSCHFVLWGGRGRGLGGNLIPATQRRCFRWRIPRQTDQRQLQQQETCTLGERPWTFAARQAAVTRNFTRRNASEARFLRLAPRKASSGRNGQSIAAEGGF